MRWSGNMSHFGLVDADWVGLKRLSNLTAVSCTDCKTPTCLDFLLKGLGVLMG